MKYRKIPVVIEATQWHKNGDHPLDECALVDGRFLSEGKVVRYFRRPDVPGGKPCEYCGKRMDDHGWIDGARNGGAECTVCPGDWVITGVNGEYYPCKPDIFAKTYKPADESVTEIGEVTMQQIIDVGLNAFGLQLFVESVAGKSDAKTFNPFSFKYKGVRVTLQPDGEVDTRHQ